MDKAVYVEIESKNQEEDDTLKKHLEDESAQAS